MARQLVLVETDERGVDGGRRLVETEHDWRIDDSTREVGRRGLAAARAALAAAGRQAAA